MKTDGIERLIQKMQFFENLPDIVFFSKNKVLENCSKGLYIAHELSIIILNEFLLVLNWISAKKKTSDLSIPDHGNKK